MNIRKSFLIAYWFIGISVMAQNIPINKAAYIDNTYHSNSPNIIYIYIDDLGYGDLGNFWQNQRTADKKMLTPAIDQLADEGAMLTHHYTAAPVCAPARASLLEGLHQGHSSIRNNQFDKPLADGLNVAQLLSKAGYRTMHIGKAGLAGQRNSSVNPYPNPETLAAHPLKRGFDQFFGYLFHNQGHLHYPEPTNTKKYSYLTDGYTIIMDNTSLCYTTDIFTAKSKQWIIEHRAATPEQPFFLYLAYDVPHSELQVPTQPYPSGGGLSGGVLWTGASSATPYINTASGTKDSFIHPDYASKAWTINEKKHATMIRRVDNAVADILQLLKDLNIDEQTMIVFSSDNGAHNTGGQNPQSFQSYGNFNGIKRDMWEGGIRVPTICRYPGVVPAGTEMTFPCGQWDWLATFCDLANAAIPAYTDGVSLMPSLRQISVKQVNKGYTYHEYAVNSSTPSYDDFEPSKRGRKRAEMQVIRMGKYKGVRYNITSHNTPFEIYDIINDERETRDLATAMPELHQQIKDKVLQVRKGGVVSRPYDNELIPSIELPEHNNGLERRLYSGTHQWVPDFNYLTCQSSSSSQGPNDARHIGQTSELGLFYTGYIKVPEDGTYTFYLQSASNCHVMIHDIHLLDNDYHFTTEEQSEIIKLKAGLHPIRIYYQQNEMMVPEIQLSLQGPGLAKSTIPYRMFYSSATSTDNHHKSSKPDIHTPSNAVHNPL